MKCMDESFFTNDINVMRKRKSIEANRFEVIGDYLHSQVGEYTYTYAMVCMGEHLFVTGMYLH